MLSLSRPSLFHALRLSSRSSQLIWDVPRRFESSNSKEKQRKTNRDIIKTLSSHLWPSGAENAHIRQRVMWSVGFLVASKVVNIQVPFLFKEIVDSLSTTADPSLAATLPLGLLCGYGIGRFSANAFQVHLPP
jgi:hypothetical protein